MKKILRSQEGFTLVELLIVIVIIGILAGVVIGVLNPVQQQNRARDGTTRAQLDKMALSTKSLFVSSPRNTDRSPTQLEFIAGLSNVAGPGCTDGDAAAESSCLFAINNQPLPATCGVTEYTSSDGSTQCMFSYWRNGTGFRIAGRGAAQPVSLFVYHFEELADGNVNEGFYSCVANGSYTVDTTPVNNADCNLLN